MTLSRRRFLTIAAGFAASPAAALSHSWQGRAFGASVSITLHGPKDMTRPALQHAQQLIADLERLFSLYAPTSDLVRLNRAGWIAPEKRFLALMRSADAAHRLTGGLFDPSVQPLWRALSEGGDVARAKALIGWDRVRFDANRVTLAPGQALTFNGIAQGFATDLVAEALKAHGAERTLVNIGEYRGSGEGWHLGVEDPQFGRLAALTLSDGAVATSSPAATPLGAKGHILHSRAAPRWSTVLVEAETATLADALSTAMVLAPLEQVHQLRWAAGVRRIMLVDKAGDLISL